MSTAHKDITTLDNHHPYRWVFANVTERLSEVPVEADLYKRALQLDNEKEYTLISLSPVRWKEYGATNSIPTTIVARLNPSPLVTVIEGLSIDPNSYSCLNLTSTTDVMLVSTPNILAATNNAQELTLVNIGNHSITFQSELNVTGSQMAEDFTLSPTNRVAKLIFIKGLDRWYKY